MYGSRVKDRRGRSWKTASKCVCVCLCVIQQLPHSPDILQWMALMNNNPTRGARVVFLQILHETAPADWRQTHTVMVTVHRSINNNPDQL